MRHIGLFEGIGGFSLAARWMGWATVAWCEWDEFNQRVLRHHFPEAEGHGDITKTDFTPYADTIEILTGGFPCQPYSTAGKRLGTADARHLWPQMLRAIREVRPRWVVGENVSGLVSWNDGLVFEQVHLDLEAEGYEVQPFILPACAVNAPHRRDRVWFIAYSCRLGHRRGNQQSQSNKTKEWPVCSEEQQHRDRIWSQIEGCCPIITNSNSKGLQGGKDERNIGESWQKSDEQFARFFRTGWEEFPTQPPVCGGNDGIPRELDSVTFSKWRKEAIRAYGNAIVPQVAYQIFKAIQQYQTLDT